jgi:hypothetical protein
MTLEDTKRVEDVRDSYEANKYLDRGWVLVGSPDTCGHYALAWQRSDAPPDYPPDSRAAQAAQYAGVGRAR